MNTAQLQGLRNLHTSTVTITKVGTTFEVRRGGQLLGVTATIAGARELAAVAS